jgi:hypothetical protein
MTPGAAKKAIKTQGPCAFCGHPYAYHRMAEAQIGRVAAGEPIESTAADYGETIEDMATKWNALLDLWPPS